MSESEVPEEKRFKEIKDKLPPTEVIKAEWEEAIHEIPDGIYMTSNGYKGYKPKEENNIPQTKKYDFKG